MGFPIKTSDTNWLAKALELFEKRTSISITDDANYNLDLNSDSMKLFRKLTLNHRTLMIMSLFYALSLLCAILFYLSLKLKYSQALGVILSAAGVVVCFAIPTYYLRKNRKPKIEKTDKGVDIKFY
jgi:hypothetical protein